MSAALQFGIAWVVETCLSRDQTTIAMDDLIAEATISRRELAAAYNYAGATTVSESRNGLKTTLEGKVSNDHSRVFQRLGVNEIDDDLAERCASELLIAKANCVAKLQSLERATKNDELAMYSPLVSTLLYRCSGV